MQMRRCLVNSSNAATAATGCLPGNARMADDCPSSTFMTANGLVRQRSKSAACLQWASMHACRQAELLAVSSCRCLALQQDGAWKRLYSGSQGHAEKQGLGRSPSSLARLAKDRRGQYYSGLIQGSSLPLLRLRPEMGSKRIMAGLEMLLWSLLVSPRQPSTEGQIKLLARSTWKRRRSYGRENRKFGRSGSKRAEVCFAPRADLARNNSTMP